MVDEPIRDVDGYQLQTGLFGLDPSGRRWLLGGGREEPGVLVLNFMVFHPEDHDRVKRYEVRIPIRVDRHDLIVGEAEAHEV